MNKNGLIYASAFIVVAVILTSCGPGQFAVYSPEETLSLNKITDNEENKYDSPFGGDNGRDLFFAVRDKRGRSNIYCKTNPIATAMSPKTDGNNINITPSYCPKTNLLAYSGMQEGATVPDIFMMDASKASAIRRLTNTPTELERYPCLSTDGKTVIYEKCYIGGILMDTQIWRQDLQNETTTLLAQGRMPSISHDGHNIVFVRYTPDGASTYLVVMDINGQNQTELTDAKMGYVSVPRFSPNDRQIVFQCKKKDKKDVDLYVINRDGTGLTQLTFNKSYDAEPYWASDGYIYFSSDRGGKANNFQIWRFKYGESQIGGYTPQHEFNEIKTPAVQPTREKSAERFVYHVVQQGETITEIARRYGSTVRDIVKWNNLTTMTITAGTRLKVSVQ